MFDWFLRGGPIMIPLAALSVVALTIIFERLWMLRPNRYLDPAQVAVVGQLLSAREFNRAAGYCREHEGPFPSLVLTLIENRNAPYDELREVLEDTGRHQLRQLERGLGALATVVASAPLLGLLGTVLGMIQVFESVSASGLARGQQLSGGIAQALITTAAGLVIAIPALFLHAYLEGRASSLVTAIEARILELLHLVRRPGGSEEEA